MIYRFTLFSGEQEGFLREYKLDPECTFLDLHRLILQSVGYAAGQPTSFFICEDNWEMRQEVTLEDMGGRSDEDNYLMSTTLLSDLLEDEGQRLVYVFDPLTERTFLMELAEIITGKEAAAPACTYRSGAPPPQEIDLDAFTEKIMAASGVANPFTEDAFDEDEDFDEGDIDPEGFDFSDGDPYP
jgi:hypothetical protein